MLDSRDGFRPAAFARVAEELLAAGGRCVAGAAVRPGGPGVLSRGPEATMGPRFMRRTDRERADRTATHPLGAGTRGWWHVVTRAERNSTDPDLGVMSGRLLFSVQQELFAALAELGFDDLKHRHGAVLAYLDTAGVRLTELARLSHQYKQVIGTLVDELVALGYVERRPDPSDRRAKLVCPTERGRAQMRAADAILAAMQRRHAQLVGPEQFEQFRRVFFQVVENQRAYVRQLPLGG